MLSSIFNSFRHTLTEVHPPKIYLDVFAVVIFSDPVFLGPVTDCRQAKHFLVSALLLLSETTISSDTAGQSPSRNHIRERTEGVTNHITNTDSLQSLCTFDHVLRLCSYRSE